MPMDTTTMSTLRRFIAEYDQTLYSDALLNDMYDANDGDVNITAAEVWSEKAARAATLVDTSEGPSSRKMSQVYSQAKEQAAFYGSGTGATSAPVTRSARTRAIERP
jgi:hypothetical protein